VRPGESSEQEVLNRLAAIQAAAEILDDNNDLSRNDYHLFLTVIRSETARLHRMLQNIMPAFAAASPRGAHATATATKKRNQCDAESRTAPGT
jgi:hypothetical protein